MQKLAQWRPGDTIANLTKRVGIAPCLPCKKRQESLNLRYQQIVQKLKIKAPK